MRIPSQDPETLYVFNESWALNSEYVEGILASLVNVVLRRLLQAETAGATDRQAGRTRGTSCTAHSEVNQIRVF